MLKKAEADLGSASIVYLSGWAYVLAEGRNFKLVCHRGISDANLCLSSNLCLS